MLEVDFKSNSIPQNRFVRWGLHLTYIYDKIVLSLVKYETSNTPSHVKVYTSCAWE